MNYTHVVDTYNSSVVQVSSYPSLGYVDDTQGLNIYQLLQIVTIIVAIVCGISYKMVKKMGTPSTTPELSEQLPELGVIAPMLLPSDTCSQWHDNK